MALRNMIWERLDPTKHFRPNFFVIIIINIFLLSRSLWFGLSCFYSYHGESQWAIHVDLKGLVCTCCLNVKYGYTDYGLRHHWLNGCVHCTQGHKIWMILFFRHKLYRHARGARMDSNGAQHWTMSHLCVSLYLQCVGSPLNQTGPNKARPKASLGFLRGGHSETKV